MHSTRNRYSVSAVDLDAVAAEVNHRFGEGGLEAAEAVGRYLLDVFFDGRAAAFRSRDGRYEEFRALTQREDLKMSYSFLWTAIAVVEQLRALPPDLARKLPLAHHRALLTIKDTDLKIRTARYAIEHGLSKRDLEQRVRRVRPTEPKRGRRRLPELERAARDLATALEHFREVRADASTQSLVQTDRGRVTDLLKDIDRSIAEIGLLARGVRATLEAV